MARSCCVRHQEAYYLDGRAGAGMEVMAEVSVRLPEPGGATLPPAVMGPVQGEVQLHVGQLALEPPAGHAEFQEYQVLPPWTPRLSS